MSNSAESVANTINTAATVTGKVAAGAQYGGGSIAFLGGMTANEIAAFGGLAVAVIGFIVNTVVNFWFKHQHLKIAREKAQADPEA